MPPQSHINSPDSSPSTEEAVSPLDRLISKLRSYHVSFSVEPAASSTDDEEDCKTLVWKATTRGRREASFFYFCTALRMKDRVNQSMLRQILREYRLKDTDVTLQDLELAETSAAESLTGFPSGTIPPMGHQVPLTLLVDPALLMGKFVRAGSGQIGTDIRFATKEFLLMASHTSQLIVRPITNEGKRILDTAPQKAAALLTPCINPRAEKNTLVKNTVSLGKLRLVLSTWNEKPLATRLRDMASRTDDIARLETCIAEAGPNLADLLYGDEENTYTKTPVHNAAWRGTMKAVDALLQAGKEQGHDFLNLIAVGEGNYGKTPIFYALTRAREDMVSHLLDLGANLLIVNNKGQTPLSLAESHMSPPLCKRMAQLEEDQLRNGGSFVNYRTSHSDGRKYGDLDPRFPIDPDNLADDIVPALVEFEWKRPMLPSIQGIPVGPNVLRSVRRTTNEIRTAMACERWGKTPKLKFLMQQHSTLSLSSSRSETSSSQAMKQDKTSETVAVIDCNQYGILRLEDTTLELPPEIVFVDNLESLERFSRAVVACKMPTKTEALSDDDIVKRAWGVDAEWRPFSIAAKSTPVALLQLASPCGAIFLLDLQTLCQPSQAKPDLELNPVEGLLSETLVALFRNADTALVGFGICQDLRRLAHSFPHLPCFGWFESVIDLQSVSSKALDDPRIRSLQTYVAVLMKKKLDKSQQCSDWEIRPLQPSQLEYAALDAAVARPLLKATLHKWQEKSKNTPFFLHFPQLRQSSRMTYLFAEEAYNRSIRYRVVSGHDKTQLGTRYCQQSWPTGTCAPEMPSRVETSKTSCNSKARVSGKKPTRLQLRQKKGISLNQLSAAGLAELPQVGTRIGYSRDSCVEAILGRSVINSLPDDFRLRYNRRGGIISLRNAWLLFISSLFGDRNWKYDNKMSDGGRTIDFAVDTERGVRETDLPFMYDLGFYDNSLDYVPTVKPNRTIFLFMRRNSGSKYLYCGRCASTEWSFSDNGMFNVKLSLLEADELLEGEGSIYRQIVEEKMLEHESPTATSEAQSMATV
jgi:hypothetical protein